MLSLYRRSELLEHLALSFCICTFIRHTHDFNFSRGVVLELLGFPTTHADSRLVLMVADSMVDPSCDDVFVKTKSETFSLQYLVDFSRLAAEKFINMLLGID